MDKSELYKDMCFKARELQGVFQILVDRGEAYGSKVFVKWSIPDRLGGLEDVMLHPSAVYGLEKLDHDWYVCNGILRGKICRESLEEIDPGAQVVWLSSADQLKNFLKPVSYTHNATRYGSCLDVTFEDKKIYNYDYTEEQCWLRCAMKRMYFKIWNGVDWVAINSTEEPN
jgi:hypothetical protein